MRLGFLNCFLGTNNLQRGISPFFRCCLAAVINRDLLRALPCRLGRHLAVYRKLPLYLINIGRNLSRFFMRTTASRNRLLKTFV